MGFAGGYKGGDNGSKNNKKEPKSTDTNKKPSSLITNQADNNAREKKLPWHQKGKG